jgi:hypothetical protein
MYDLNGYHKIDNFARYKNKYNFWKALSGFKSRIDNSEKNQE